MAFSAFLLALLRSDLVLEEDEESLHSLLEEAMRRGTAGLRPELERLLGQAEKGATAEERRYLPLVAKRIEEGSLAELMIERLQETGAGEEKIKDLMRQMQWCLKENRPYSAKMGS